MTTNPKSGDDQHHSAPLSLGDLIARARRRISEISAEDLDTRLEDNESVLVIDVREPAEFALGHIPGALLIPRGTLEAAADAQSPHRVERLCGSREQSIVLYCESGGRSALAAATLKDMGYKDVQSLAGGSVMWEAEGLPLVRETAAGSS